MEFLTEDYRDHTIFASALDSRDNPGEYLSSFIVSKNGEDVARATVANRFNTADEANRNAIRIGKQRLDELLDV